MTETKSVNVPIKPYFWALLKEAGLASNAESTLRRGKLVFPELSSDSSHPVYSPKWLSEHGANSTADF